MKKRFAEIINILIATMSTSHEKLTAKKSFTTVQVDAFPFERLFVRIILSWFLNRQ